MGGFGWWMVLGGKGFGSERVGGGMKLENWVLRLETLVWRNWDFICFFERWC